MRSGYSQAGLPDRVKAPIPNVARVFLAASRAHTAAIVALLAKRGYADVPIASASLLWLLDEGGTRSTVLAQRAGVTKQAMSQLVRLMERQGYLKQVPDCADTRAKVVRMTPQGEAVKAACVEVREELNERAVKLVGPELEAHLQALTRMFTDMANES